MGGAVVLGAVVRLVYLMFDAHVDGDGFYYHVQAIRFANGHGYTSPFAPFGLPAAIHPPAWVTVLGLFSDLGATSVRWHQVVGIGIGLVVVLLAGLVGRRYFNWRVGIVAAFLAALYPGFWVVDAQILSEPLDLVLLGVLMLVVADLRDRPTVLRAVAAGATCGVAALTRSEEVALLVIVVVPTIIVARPLSGAGRTKLVCVASLSFVVVLLPWIVYNSARFTDPVLMSTDGGGALLAGNCPAAYNGTNAGYFDASCAIQAHRQNRQLDESQLDGAMRRAALQNASDNLGHLPVVAAMRYGRTLAVFRPQHTVNSVSMWMGTHTWPIWLWVASFWVLLPLSAIGIVVARRSGVFLLPLLGPLIVVCVVVTLTSGEPRFHTPADLGLVVLAAGAIEWLWKRSQPCRSKRSSCRPS